MTEARSLLGSPLLSAGSSLAKKVVGFWDTKLGGYVTEAITVVVIVALAIAVRLIAHWAIRLFVNRVVNGVKRRQHTDDTRALLVSPVAAARTVQRTRTLGSVLNNIVSVLVAIIAVLLIIQQVAPGITGAFSLITAALGAGLGFGAQNPVKDVLTGLFMVADDQLGVGDVVQTDLATGVVEAVGIRVTQIRDVNGVLWFIRNGEITRVGNLSQGWSRAIVDVSVPHEADVEAVQHRMLEVANRIAADPQWATALTEQPELWGIESVTPDAVIVRLVQRTRITSRDDVAWALRTHLLEALTEMGVTKAAIATAPADRYETAGVLRGVRAAGTGPSPTRPRRSATQTRPGAPAERPVARRSTATGATGRSGSTGASGATGPGVPLDTDGSR